MEQKVYLQFNDDEVMLGTVAEVLAHDDSYGINTGRTIWQAVAAIVCEMFYDEFNSDNDTTTVTLLIR